MVHHSIEAIKYKLAEVINIWSYGPHWGNHASQHARDSFSPFKICVRPFHEEFDGYLYWCCEAEDNTSSGGGDLLADHLLEQRYLSSCGIEEPIPKVSGPGEGLRGSLYSNVNCFIGS